MERRDTCDYISGHHTENGVCSTYPAKVNSLPIGHAQRISFCLPKDYSPNTPEDSESCQRHTQSPPSFPNLGLALNFSHGMESFAFLTQKQNVRLLLQPIF